MLFASIKMTDLGQSFENYRAHWVHKQSVFLFCFVFAFIFCLFFFNVIFDYVVCLFFIDFY